MMKTYLLSINRKQFTKVAYILIILGCLYSCSENRVDIKSGRCIELAKVAKQINDNAPFKWTNGYTIISATYKDKLFTYRFMVDDSLESYSKISKHMLEFKEKLLIGIRTSTERERDIYKDFVEYGVTLKSIFDCKVSKEVYVFTISPSEINESLNAKISPQEELKQFTEVQQKVLPSTIMRGIVISEIELRKNSVYMKFLVDDFQDLLNEEENFGMEWIDWFSKNNKQYLSLVAEANFGIIFYFCDPISYCDTTIKLTDREIKLLSLQ